MTPVKRNQQQLQLLPKSRTGITGLDEITQGGLPKGRPTLVAGATGCGKTLLAMQFLVNGVIKYDEPGVFVAFEETAEDLAQNVASLGFDLKELIKQKKMIIFYTTRPTLYGLEMHLVTMYDLVNEYKPDILVMDPITDFFAVGSSGEVKAAITRIVDFLKTKQITALFTSITSEADAIDNCLVGISSLIDTWISVRNLEKNEERLRGLYILKSRGMAHSNQIRSLQLTDDGSRSVRWIWPVAKSNITRPQMRFKFISYFFMALPFTPGKMEEPFLLKSRENK